MFLFAVLFLNRYVHKALCKLSIVYALVFFTTHFNFLSNFIFVNLVGVDDAVPKLNSVMKAALEDANALAI